MMVIVSVRLRALRGAPASACRRRRDAQSALCVLRDRILRRRTQPHAVGNARTILHHSALSCEFRSDDERRVHASGRAGESREHDSDAPHPLQFYRAEASQLSTSDLFPHRCFASSIPQPNLAVTIARPRKRREEIMPITKKYPLHSSRVAAALSAGAGRDITISTSSSPVTTARPPTPRLSTRLIRDTRRSTRFHSTKIESTEVDYSGQRMTRSCSSTLVRNDAHVTVRRSRTLRSRRRDQLRGRPSGNSRSGVWTAPLGLGRLTWSVMATERQAVSPRAFSVYRSSGGQRSRMRISVRCGRNSFDRFP